MTKRHVATLSAATAAALFAAATPALSQSAPQGLSEQEVKDFLGSAEQDMTQAINAGNYDRVVDWTRQNIADGATFFFSGEIFAGDQRKGFAVFSLNKQDMLQMSQAAVGILAGAQGQQVQDYTLDIEVVKVKPIGPDAATVQTRITERGELGAPGDGDKAIQVVSTADCNHVVQAGGPSGGDQLKLAMSACQARTEF